MPKLKSIPASIINEEFENGEFDGKTLLCIACKKGYLKIVKELLKRDGTDVNKSVSIVVLNWIYFSRIHYMLHVKEDF